MSNYAAMVAVSLSICVSLAVVFSLVFGAAGAESEAALARKQAAADKPLPHPLGLFTNQH